LIMNKRRFLLGLLVIMILALCLAGCSNSENDEPEITATPIPTKDAEPTEAVPTDEPKVTTTPVPTKEPVVTVTPEPTVEPVITEEPTPTERPDPETLSFEEVFKYYPENFPIIDSSTARKPITASIYEYFMGEDGTVNQPMCSKTHGAWLNLADEIADIVFLVAPTDEEETYFRERQVNIEMKPYGYDGLGFIVSPDCEVKSLTQDQIRGIYEGKINNWSELGGPDADIHPYFRNDQSGSQRLFEAFLWPDGDAPDFSSMLDHFYFEGDMSSITESVAWDPYAIGYNIISYLDLEYEDYIVAVEIDGAKPTTENFKNKSYPYITTAYVAIRADEPENSYARKLFEWIGSEESIRIIELNSSLSVDVGESDILHYNTTELMSQAYEDYLAGNANVIEEHEAKYLAELRKEYKDVPIHRLKLLTKFDLDERNTVEIYELAAYGHPVTYETTESEENGYLEFNATGIDKDTELYRYDIVARLLVDGKYAAECYMTEEQYIPYKEIGILNYVTWQPSDITEAKAICEMIGLKYEDNDQALCSVTVIRPVDKEAYDYSFVRSASYYDNEKKPAFTEEYMSYDGNDGGILDDCFHMTNGDDFNLYGGEPNGSRSLEYVKDGSGTLNGADIDWTLFEAQKGTQVVKIYRHPIDDMPGIYEYYLYLKNNLIMLRYEYDI